MRRFMLSLIIFTGLAVTASDGVILYEKGGYLGKSEVFCESDPNLQGNPIGNDSAQAVRIPRGCRVVLYEHKNYKGRHIQLTGDESNLKRLGMGDRVSSIWIEWEETRPQVEGGVALFSKKNYGGRREVLASDNPDLRNSAVGNDRIKSILIPRGWTVTLFEHKDYRGRSEVLRGDDPDLSNNPIGLNRASSIRIKRGASTRIQRSEASRRPGSSRKPVTLYEHRGFKGRQEFLFNDDPDLADNRIGNDRLSSIKIPPGVVVTLYQHAHYRGRSVELTDNVENLKGFGVGNDSASSIRIERRTSRSRSSQTVILYEHKSYKGRAAALTRDCPNLKKTALGNDALTSLRVPKGWCVTLYEHANYKGRSEDIFSDDPNLKNNRIGNDRVSSVRIRRVTR